MFLSTNSLEEFYHTFIERFRFLPPIIGNSVWAGSAPVLFRSNDHFHSLGVVQLKLPLCWHRYTLVASEPHRARASHDSPLLFLSRGASSIPFQPRYYQIHFSLLFPPAQLHGILVFPCRLVQWWFSWNQLRACPGRTQTAYLPSLPLVETSNFALTIESFSLIFPASVSCISYVSFSEPFLFPWKLFLLSFSKPL